MKPLILLVEDNSTEAMLTHTAFTDYNSEIDCHVAEDGERAIDVLWGAKKIKPDLIMIDIGLPKLGGKELLRQIKGDESLKSIPTIMFSGVMTVSDRVQSYKWKANDCIQKPETYRGYCEMVKGIENKWITSPDKV